MSHIERVMNSHDTGVLQHLNTHFTGSPENQSRRLFTSVCSHMFKAIAKHFQQLCKYTPLLHLQGFYVLLLMCHSSLCMLLVRFCWCIHARGSTGVLWSQRDEFWLTDDCTSGFIPDKVRISVQPVGWWWLIIDLPVYMMNFWLRQPHWPNMVLQTWLKSPHIMIIWLWLLRINLLWLHFGEFREVRSFHQLYSSLSYWNINNYQKKGVI